MHDKIDLLKEYLQWRAMPRRSSQNVSIRAKTSIERGVNATDYCIGVNDDCLWLCGDVCHSNPSIPTYPQEPWEAQEEAHRDRSTVKFSFCVSPGAATRRERG